MAEKRTVTLHMDSVTQTTMQHETNHDEWFRAIGRVSTWNMTFAVVDIYTDGATDLVAVYRNEEGGAPQYTIGAVWHEDHYGFHS